MGKKQWFNKFTRYVTLNKNSDAGVRKHKLEII